MATQIRNDNELIKTMKPVFKKVVEYVLDKINDADGEPDEWYTELVNVGDTIIKKYENTEFAEFAKAVVLAHLEDIDVRVRKCRK